MLREFPQLWHRYKGGGQTSGSAGARGSQVAGVVCLRTWCLKGCILKSIDASKPEKGFVLLSRVGAKDSSGSYNGDVYVESARDGAVAQQDAEGRIPLLSMKVPDRPKETEGWFIAIGKATASGNAAGEDGGLGSMLSMQKSTVVAPARVVQERNSFGGSQGYTLASFKSMGDSDTSNMGAQGSEMSSARS